MYTVDNEFKETALHDLGNFEVTSEKLMVSDPCYNLGTWCQGILENVRNGKWRGLSVKGKTDWGNRVWEVRAVHSDYSVDIAMSEKMNIDVGVDSGQAGFFDLSHFKGGQDEYGDGGWYDQCCDLTLGPAGGVVTSSGFGDGSYRCYVARDNGQIVAAKIVFVLREEEYVDEEE